MVCAGALGVLALFAGPAGCAAGATSDGPLVNQDANPNDPGNSQTLPPSSNSSSSGGDDGMPTGDAGPVLKPKGDGGSGSKADGGITIVDAGPPPPAAPNPGDTCTQQDQVVKVACGFCGTKQTICTMGTDGALTWSVYDSCVGEHGVCAAGSTGVQDCNNCGTRSVTCSASCTWQAGACSAQAGVGCVPGSWDLTTAGCPAGSAGQYRVRQCDAQCHEGNYTNVCEAPPTTVEIGPSVGSISSTVAVLGGQIGKIDTYSCPISSISSTLVAYAYTQVHNPLAVSATVDIYNSAAPNSTVVTQTQITAYDSDVAPTTADDRKKCVQTSNEGTSSLTGSFGLASLDDSKKVTIPAGQTFTVFTNSRNSAAGPIKVNVKLEALGSP